MGEFTAHDYGSFIQLGFEVVKDRTGHFYVRPFPHNASMDAVYKAKEAAMEAGIAFGSNGYILDYKKPTNDNSN